MRAFRNVRSFPFTLCVLLASACNGGSAEPEGATGTNGAGTPTTTTTTTSPPAEIRGCVPQCVAGITEPGDLPAGEYQTEWFFGGEMLLTFDAGWTSGEDSTGEFTVSPIEATENGIFFWEDVYPVEEGRARRGRAAHCGWAPRLDAGELSGRRFQDEQRVDRRPSGHGGRR
jgi:hypothetical protein